MNFPDFLKFSSSSLRALRCAIPRLQSLFKIEIPLILSSVLASLTAFITSDKPTVDFSENKFTNGSVNFPA